MSVGREETGRADIRLIEVFDFNIMYMCNLT